jgi:SAM-dependent methyltransferase
MYNQLLNYLNRRPDLYQSSTSKFWDDEHISKSMLEAHLNPELEAATRKHDFVKKSAEWIANIANPAERPRLLDLGCGPGIYADLFARKGFDVTGIDLSPRSIEYAKKHTNHSIEYICQNYLDLGYAMAFDVVTLIYCDFGVICAAERKTLLRKIFSALQEDGLFFVDVCSPAQYEGWEENHTWSYSNGGFWSAEPYACLYSFYRFDNCRSYDEQYVIIEKEAVRCFNIWNHAFTPDELCADLADAGFKSTQLFGSVAGKDYTDQSAAICAVARK